jgi:hypothetical protein
LDHKKAGVKLWAGYGPVLGRPGTNRRFHRKDEPLLGHLNEQNILRKALLDGVFFGFYIPFRKMREPRWFSSIVTTPWVEWPRNQGSIPGSSKKFFSSPKRPNGFWVPNIILFSGYRSLLPRNKAAGA